MMTLIQRLAIDPGRRSRPARTGAVVLACAVLALAACGDQGAAPARPAVMAAAANPYAARAALEILKQGGSAIDAAITTQLVLTLVEPQSSGIGGGAYLMHWDRKQNRISAYDGRERAPRTATPDLFMKNKTQPMGFFEAVVGGRAVGAPGVIAMLHAAHAAHGRVSWKKLFEPAIALAEGGFKVSPRLHQAIARHARYLRHSSVRDYFFASVAGNRNLRVPLPVGHVLKNPAYARSLRRISTLGPNGFYQGALAQAIVDTVRGADSPGLLSLGDLAGYRTKLRSALCISYRQWRICGMPPSTSGGITVLQILKMLETYSMHKFRPGSPMAVHLISEASKLAYADRGRYIGDPDFVPVPVHGMIDTSYMRARARSIDPGRAAQSPKAGTPPDIRSHGWAQAKEISRPSTTHFTLLDDQGNVVSATSSVENAFGAHIMAGGFILNNQLTDFSFRPTLDGKPVANSVEGGKRPRSSMSPTLVFDRQGRLFAALGSPGGSRIIAFVAQTLVGLLDWRLDMQAAISLPRHVNRLGGLELEAGTVLAAHANKLRALGHDVSIRALTSGLHGIRFAGPRPDGGADPRREGVVLTNMD